MSAAPQLIQRDAVTPSAPGSTRLHVITGRTPRLGRNAFGLLIGAILILGLLTVLLLNTVLAQGAFTIHTLEKSATSLEVQQQALERQVAALETPESLQLKATALGMVRANTPVFLRLRDHRVLGVPQAVTLPQPSASATAPPQPVPSPSASTVKSGSSPKPTIGKAVPAPEGAESQAAAVAGAPRQTTSPSPAPTHRAAGDGAVVVPKPTAGSAP